MTNTDNAPTPSRRHSEASARRAMPQGYITIGLVENDPYALALLRPQIERLDPQFSILWAVSTGAKAIHHCLFTSPRPQVLVIDMGLSDMPGTRVCEILRQHGCTAGVVGITALPTADWAARLAACGGQALIAKDLIRGNLRPAIVAAAAGQAYQSEGNGTSGPEHAGNAEEHASDRPVTGTTAIYPSVQEAIACLGNTGQGTTESASATATATASTQPPANPLSPRQQQVLAAYAAGETTGRIAKTLHTSNATVYVHLHDALARLGAASKIEAIDIARKNAWIHVEQYRQ
ncbi:response regulator transcription factor [uncultured Bifidobacterium sp.]|uniref:response regulator transcription factor n=1 Tax=uncultured Bifidobacterium sp. TaxID=165187 RepID=UPI00258277E2|nr:response regulator transcription factor [uncultured Bifidobacterium sp.]